MLACAYRNGETPVNLAAAPMTHTAGLLAVPCTAQGGTVVVVTKPDPALMLRAIMRTASVSRVASSRASNDVPSSRRYPCRVLR